MIHPLKREATWPTGLYRRGQIYYARFSQRGTDQLRSLKTDHFPTAKLMLTRVQSDAETARQSGQALDGMHRTMAALEREVLDEIKHNVTLQEATKRQYDFKLARLRKAWPQDFDSTPVRSIDRRFIMRLRSNLSGFLSGSCVNSSLWLLQRMLNLAVTRQIIAQSPFVSETILRDSIMVPYRRRVPELPSTENLNRMFEEMEKPNLYSTDGSWLADDRRLSARRSGEFARFLAYSGMRWREARRSRISDYQGDWIHVRGTKTETSLRKVPVTRELRALLDGIIARRKAENDPNPMFIEIKTCLERMAMACERLGIPVLTHHDLRHYFATQCIESGVPIPTVADWLGHSDGGKVLLKVYRHLRDNHSLAEAAKVSFSGAAPAPLPPVASFPATLRAIPA